MKYCNQCGSPMDDSSAFCPNCGTPTSDSAGNGGYAPDNNNFKGGGYTPDNNFKGGYDPGYGSGPSGGGYDPGYNPGYNGGYGAPGGSMGLVASITSRMRTCATIWKVIGIIQIICGACTLIFGYGVVALFLGIWNVVQSSKLRKSAAYFDQTPVGIVNFFESRGTIIIVFLVLNLLGSLLGVVGSIYELILRSDVMSHRNELFQIEASYTGGYNNGGYNGGMY